MASEGLEFPGQEGSPDWEALYLYRKDEVTPYRPIFTGDVFASVLVEGLPRTVMILQHPCALRIDGVTLVERIPVVLVHEHRLLEQSEWRGNYRLMPLPAMGGEDDPLHYAGHFTDIVVVTQKMLDEGTRVACLSPLGVNLALQRWVFHNSRAAIPTHVYDKVTSPQYEEADSIEEWVEVRAKKRVSFDQATKEADAWLSDPGPSGISTRSLLEDPQYRKRIRLRCARKPSG